MVRVFFTEVFEPLMMLATDRSRWLASIRCGQYVQNSGQPRLARIGNPLPIGRTISRPAMPERFLADDP
jgi:hypothetical protein